MLRVDEDFLRLGDAPLHLDVHDQTVDRKRLSLASLECQCAHQVFLEQQRVLR